MEDARAILDANGHVVSVEFDTDQARYGTGWEAVCTCGASMKFEATEDDAQERARQHAEKHGSRVEVNA